MPIVNLKSVNYNGQIADITFYPATGGTVSIGLQTIPYLYNALYVYGSYDFYFSFNNVTCGLVIPEPPIATTTTTEPTTTTTEPTTTTTEPTTTTTEPTTTTTEPTTTTTEPTTTTTEPTTTTSQPTTTTTTQPTTTTTTSLLAIVQSDTTFTQDPFCSGQVAANTVNRYVAAVGGNVGSQCNKVNIGGSSTVYGVEVKWVPTNGTNWNAGTWTWRLNICGADANCIVSSVYICRVNSSDVTQSTIGSSTGLSISCGSVGVLSGTITGSAQTPSVGDYVVVVFVFTNLAMSANGPQVIGDQTISTPFT